MDSRLFKAKNVIVQGITGTHGSFHTKAMLDAGTPIVAGTSPNKAGERIYDVPVYAAIRDIQQDFTVDASVIFVPAPFAKQAIIEAIEANIPLVMCITEGIPVHDMLDVTQRLRGSNTTLIGPNCPGILMPDTLKIGIIPAAMGKKGTIGIVSRSGTLTYEAAANLTDRGIGQKYIIGIGGDPIRGTDFIDCLSLFQNDPDVTAIILIGEIGGSSEQMAATFIKHHVTKPVYAYIAGHGAPKGVQLGHAGAILGSDNESAAAKTAILQQAGAKTYDSIITLANDVR